MVSRDGGRTFRFVHGGQGRGFISGTWIDIFMLRPGHDYIFKIYAGNGFTYEKIGSSTKAKTMKIYQENGNILDIHARTKFNPRSVIRIRIS